MKILTHNIYFKEGLPKVRSIKKTFYKITGLDLNYYTKVSLEELMPNIRDEIAYANYLNNYMEDPFFYCEGFQAIGPETPWDIGEKNFSIVCYLPIKSTYFFMALTKTMLELGGQQYRHGDSSEYDEIAKGYLAPYHPHDNEWKNIRTWAEMSDFEKAGFKRK